MRKRPKAGWITPAGLLLFIDARNENTMDDYKFRIEEVTFNDGTVLKPGAVTVLVGPNNTGKSRVLKDIVNIVAGSATSPLIAKRIVTSLPSTLEVLVKKYPQLVRKRTQGNPNSQGIWIAPNLCAQGGHSCSHQWPIAFEREIASGDAPKRQGFLLKHFGSGLIAHFRTEDRLKLVNQVQLNQPAMRRQHLAQALYASGLTVEKEIRQFVRDAFDMEVALDFAEPGFMRFRVGKSFDHVSTDPREAMSVLAEFELLDSQGDGIRSFVGMMVGLQSVTRDVILIDEPETFLHPPQAYRIGELIGAQAKRGRQCVVATHSAEIVKGILSTYQDATILRVDRLGNRNSFNFLDTAFVKELIDDPMLSSIRVLDGLFYTATVVVEADADARFYQAVAAKLLGRDEIYFVNADNKQTVPKILAAYRKAKIPSAGIVDFDALNSPIVLKDLIASADLPSDKVDAMIGIRDRIAKFAGEAPPANRLRETQERTEKIMGDLLTWVRACDRGDLKDDEEIERKLIYARNRLFEAGEATKAWQELKRKGATALSPELQKEFQEFYKTLGSNGMFINPIGELESMLSDQGIDVTTEKRAWILRALRLLRSLQVELDKYPWKFVNDIVRYVRITTAPNPNSPSVEVPAEVYSPQCVSGPILAQ
jgi:energy-coupling factor transporter ATP-binding protein EcfA2